jgi:hypothetical protein
MLAALFARLAIAAVGLVLIVGGVKAVFSK